MDCMKRYASTSLIAFFTAALVLAVAQQPAQPPRVISPEVHADKRVTFRFRAPTAREVLLSREGAGRVAMQKGEDGVWTLTTESLAPDMYGYSFVADGVSMMDPVNSLIKPNLLNPQSMVHVPGNNPWDVANVARGTLHRHFYHSGVVGDDRDYYVYTPPGYDAGAKKTYPVFYLLHGFSDDASGWTSVGNAHVILDNLIAQSKAQPMLIVMTLGYGAPEIVSPAAQGLRDPGVRQRSFDRFRDSLLQEVIPRIEKDYRASKDRTARAIAGLSMGGAESLYVGLNATDKFAYIGAFSSGGLGNDLAAQFPKLGPGANEDLRLLYISCGTEDRLIDANRKFVEFFKSKQVNASLRETPGAHTWTVWRRNLADFLPLLFQKKTS
jgi:enterochelin esterase-like enzyme